MLTTPGMMRSLTLAVISRVPMSLKAFTGSPSLMPRARASEEFIRTVWGSSSRSQGMLSKVE